MAQVSFGFELAKRQSYPYHWFVRMGLAQRHSFEVASGLSFYYYLSLSCCLPIKLFLDINGGFESGGSYYSTVYYWAYPP